ncbi:hypothetical protein C8R44DRAFT_892490 [Mycena epipterygia]|nr:hypothetical protein C8R44DRAFT_892490 [Mycena epipterygia]
MNLVASLPYEVLLEMFKFLDSPSVIRASHVCSQWRDISVDNSQLWLTVIITTNAIHHMDVVARVLQRSENRPICLRLDFPPTEEPLAEYCERLRSLLEGIVKPHLCRCFCLTIYADEPAWAEVIGAFTGEDFPALRMLDVRNYDVDAHWQTIELPDLEPADVVFPLPLSHSLQFASLHGLSLGAPTLPSLVHLQIGDHFPNLAPSRQMNPWILKTAACELIIEGICVPPMDFPRDDALPPSTVQHLTLRNLCATPRDTPDAHGMYEHDCSPFFRSLNTALLRSLVLDSFDLEGRVWEDFIASLPVSHDKYPLVRELTLRRIDFEEMSYDDVEFFLGAFPALQRLVLRECNAGTWANAIEVLELCPELCPGLGRLEVDDGVLPREDPIPFRNLMFEYDTHALGQY